MLEQRYRKIYQALLINPGLKFFAAYLSPNQVTLLSGIVGLLIIPALYFKHSYLAVFLLLLSGYLDTLDGSLARFLGKSSPMGSVLDIITDRVVEWAAVFALFLVDPNRATWCFLILLANLVCITSFLVVGIFVEPHNSQKSFFYHDSLMERAEAFIFFILMMLLPEYFTLLAVIYILLVGVTAALHVRFFHKWHNNKSC